MNPILDGKWAWIAAAHGLRAQVLDLLSDADLAVSPGGQTMPFGALWRELGAVEYAYRQSLQTFRHEWSAPPPDADLGGTVTQLRGWFQSQDAEMKAAIAALANADLTQPVERGGGGVSVEFQLDCYLQAVLIFLGKATIYLRAMNKPLPQAVLEYIG
jgi:hypothetical protein